MTVKAIDIHSHINSGSVFDSPEDEGYVANLETVLRLNKLAGIEKTICSTFSSVLRTEEIVKENEYMSQLAQRFPELYYWVVMDPRNDSTFEQAKDYLIQKKCVGLKLHPTYHEYNLETFGDKLFSFASEFKSVVLIHPDPTVDTVLPFADAYPDVKVIVAHLGSFYSRRYADIMENCKHQNIYADTSGSASLKNQIIEYTVSRVGSERILFGTDTYAAGSQRGRIEYADISNMDKQNILRHNAERLFGYLIDL